MSAPSGRLAAIAVLAQTVMMAVLFAVVLGLLADRDPFDGTLRDFVLVSAMHLVDGGLVVGVLLVGYGGASLAGLGWSRDPALGRSIALGLVGAALCAGIVATAGWVVGGVEGLRATVAGFAGMTVQQRLLCALIGFGAGFIEETVFRGSLQPRLVARLGAPLGIALTAVIFSAYHLKFGPVGFLVKVLFGVLFGALRQTTGRNWAPALAHFGVWVLVGFS